MSVYLLVCVCVRVCLCVCVNIHISLCTGKLKSNWSTNLTLEHIETKEIVQMSWIMSDQSKGNGIKYSPLTRNFKSCNLGLKHDRKLRLNMLFHALIIVAFMQNATVFLVCNLKEIDLGT